MELIANILLGAGAVGAGVYCLVLSRRLRSFAALEKGMGGAIAVLSRQVDELTRALDSARSEAGVSAAKVEALAARGESVAQRLELLIAAMHDLPDPEAIVRQIERQAKDMAEALAEKLAQDQARRLAEQQAHPFTRPRLVRRRRVADDGAFDNDEGTMDAGSTEGSAAGSTRLEAAE